MNKPTWSLLAVVLATIAHIECQGERTYDETEWVPIAPPEPQPQEASDRILRSTHTPLQNTYTSDATNEKLQQLYQQYLRENEENAKLAVVPLNKTADESLEDTSEREPPPPPPPQYIRYSQHRDYLENTEENPQEFHLPTQKQYQQQLLDASQVQRQPPENGKHSFPYPIEKPYENVTSYEPDALSLSKSNLLHHQQTTPKHDTDDSVQLLYVPYEMLTQKEQQRHKPVYVKHHVKPAEETKRDRLENIKKDFLQQALDAQNLQEQFQLGHTPYVYTTTTPPSKPRRRKPHQPPLAVFLESTHKAEIGDVLNELKAADSITVQDNIGPDSPKIFVGPSNLDAPDGYSKFELPYLSNVDSNRIQRKIHNLPFFVAPLSYKTPTGYSKIPLPSPHVGSVVIATHDEILEPTVRPPTTPNFLRPSPYIGEIPPTTPAYLPDLPPQIPYQFSDAAQFQSPQASNENSIPQYQQLFSAPSQPFHVPLHQTKHLSSENDITQYQLPGEVQPQHRVPVRQHEQKPHRFNPEFEGVPSTQTSRRQPTEGQRRPQVPFLETSKHVQYSTLEDIVTTTNKLETGDYYGGGQVLETQQYTPTQYGVQSLRGRSQATTPEYYSPSSYAYSGDSVPTSARVRGRKPTTTPPPTTAVDNQRYTVLEQFSVSTEQPAPTKPVAQVQNTYKFVEKQTPLLPTIPPETEATHQNVYPSDTSYRNDYESNTEQVQAQPLNYQPTGGYEAPEELPPPNANLPGLINNLQDQSVRQLLNPGLLVPTTQQQKTQTSEIPTIPTTTRTTPKPTVQTTAANKRSRSRFRVTTTTTTTTASAGEEARTSAPRRTAHRGRRPASRNRPEPVKQQTEEAVAPPSFAPERLASRQRPTEQSKSELTHSPRQRTRTRGRTQATTATHEDVLQTQPQRTSRPTHTTYGSTEEVEPQRVSRPVVHNAYAGAEEEQPQRSARPTHTSYVSTEEVQPQRSSRPTHTSYVGVEEEQPQRSARPTHSSYVSTEEVQPQRSSRPPHTSYVSVEEEQPQRATRPTHTTYVSTEDVQPQKTTRPTHTSYVSIQDEESQRASTPTRTPYVSTEDVQPQLHTLSYVTADDAQPQRVSTTHGGTRGSTEEVQQVHVPPQSYIQYERGEATTENAQKHRRISVETEDPRVYSSPALYDYENPQKLLREHQEQSIVDVQVTHPMSEHKESTTATTTTTTPRPTVRRGRVRGRSRHTTTTVEPPTRRISARTTTTTEKPPAEKTDAEEEFYGFIRQPSYLLNYNAPTIISTTTTTTTTTTPAPPPPLETTKPLPITIPELYASDGFIYYTPTSTGHTQPIIQYTSSSNVHNQNYHLLPQPVGRTDLAQYTQPANPTYPQETTRTTTEGNTYVYAPLETEPQSRPPQTTYAELTNEPRYDPAPTETVRYEPPKTPATEEPQHAPAVTTGYAQVTTNENARQRSPSKGRGRGKAHFQLPEPLKKAADEADVEGGNYPVNFPKREVATSLPTFQITVEPEEEEKEDDQVPLSSIQMVSIVRPHQNDLINEPQPLKLEKANEEAFEESTTTEAATTETPDETNGISKNEELPQTTTNPDSTPRTSRRRGVWRLIKHRLVDPLEMAESQNYQSAVVNNYFADPKTFHKEAQNVEKTTERNIFDALYQMFGISEASTAHTQEPQNDFVTDASSVESTTPMNEVPTTLFPETTPISERQVEETVTEKVEFVTHSSDEGDGAKRLEPYEVEPWQMKVIRTSTSTEVSHETEICYRGKCVRSVDARKR